MPRCPFCQTTYVDNTLFCNECGAYLLDYEGRDTFELEYAPDEQIEGFIQAPETTPDLNAAPQKSPIIRLEITNTHRKMETTLDRILYLGRLDPVANIYPEVDLTYDKGLEFGVSRRHVRIMHRGEGVFIEDLGSINGTFINGQQLVPYHPEPLINGDIIRLGRLDIAVSLS